MVFGSEELWHHDSEHLRRKLDTFLSTVKAEIANRPKARRFLPYLSLDPKDYIVSDFGESLMAQTDGERVYFNEKALSSETLEEIVDTIKHEEAHIVRRLIGPKGAIGHDFGWLYIFNALSGGLPDMYAKCTDCGNEQELDYAEHVGDFIRHGYTPCQVCKSCLYTSDIFFVNTAPKAASEPENKSFIDYLLRFDYGERKTPLLFMDEKGVIKMKSLKDGEEIALEMAYDKYGRYNRNIRIEE